MTAPLVIFDLDGTLSDASHRQHLVQGTKKDFRAFYAACYLDSPKQPAIAVLRALHAAGNEIWIWSGRSDEVIVKTFEWLAKYELLPLIRHFRMRVEGDYTPDDKLKMFWYGELTQADKERLLLTFDDRDRMVKAWRERGVTCFQVAPGDF